MKNLICIFLFLIAGFTAKSQVTIMDTTNQNIRVVYVWYGDYRFSPIQLNRAETEMFKFVIISNPIFNDTLVSRSTMHSVKFQELPDQFKQSIYSKQNNNVVQAWLKQLALKDMGNNDPMK